jgi:hypothetical protein
MTLVCILGAAHNGINMNMNTFSFPVSFATTPFCTHTHGPVLKTACIFCHIPDGNFPSQINALEQKVVPTENQRAT